MFKLQGGCSEEEVEEEEVEEWLLFNVLLKLEGSLFTATSFLWLALWQELKKQSKRSNFTIYGSRRLSVLTLELTVILIKKERK